MSRLIELMYGLAIAEGLSSTVPKLLETELRKPPHEYLGPLGYIVAALLLGVGDWLAYNRFVAQFEYKRLDRLLLDIVFPLVIFLLFAAALGTQWTLAPMVIILVYFLLSLTYMRLLVRDTGTLPPYLAKVSALGVYVALAAIILQVSVGAPYGKHLGECGCILVSALWAALNLAEVGRALRVPREESVAMGGAWTQR